MQSQCHGYFCHWCKQYAPGHLASFCPTNPYKGLKGWQLPAGTLEMVDYRNGPVPINDTQSGHPGLLSRQSSLSTGNHANTIGSRSERHRPEESGPRAITTTTLGPTYRPTYRPKRRPPPTLSLHSRESYGRLSTSISPTHYNSRGNSSPVSQTSRTFSSLRSSTPALTDEDFDAPYEYDDVETYNIVGEGNI